LLNSVLIATPCYGGVLHVGYFRSAIAIRDLCAEKQIDCNFLVTEGESNIMRGRNNILATYMGTEYQTLAMIDADIEIDPADFLKLLELKGVRGAAVNMKRPDYLECLSCFNDGKQVKRADMPAEPFTVDFLGTAVLFVDRENIEALCAAYPNKKFEDPICGPGVALFEEVIIDDWLASEDYGFCRLLHQQKIHITCHPEVIVTHYGSGAWRA